MTQETKQIGLVETQQAELARLPLWKSCAEAMLAGGIEHGNTYSAEYFEEKLRCNRDEMKFSLAISEIRRTLETRGYYLSGRGLRGDFIILPPDQHIDVLRHYSSIASDSLKRGVILGTNTRLDTLNAEERRRHEAMLEKMAWQSIFLKKTMQVAGVIKKARPSLLSP